MVIDLHTDATEPEIDVEALPIQDGRRIYIAGTSKVILGGRNKCRFWPSGQSVALTSTFPTTGQVLTDLGSQAVRFTQL